MMSGTSESYLADRDLTMHTSFVTLRIGIPIGIRGLLVPRGPMGTERTGANWRAYGSREMTGGDSPLRVHGHAARREVLNGHDVHFAVLF